MPRELHPDDALGRHWIETVYTYVALHAEPLTAHLAPPWLARVTTVEACASEQRACWREEYVGEALVALANLALDSATEEFSADKLTELRKRVKGLSDAEARKHAEYALYLNGLRLSDVTKMALEAQLAQMADWPLKLANESDADILAYKPRFEAHFAQGRAALNKRTGAEAATAVHRVRELIPLVSSLNLARRELALALEQIALANGLPKSWKDAFFRPAPQSAPDRAEARGKALAIVGVLTARQLSLTDAQTKTILGTTSPELLDAWIAKVASVPSADALLGP